MRLHASVLGLLLMAAAVTGSDGAMATAPRLSLSQTALRNGCASGLATLCSRTLLQPFDTLKTVQQMGGDAPARGVAATATAIVQQHGVGALYRGLGVAMIGAVPAMTVYMASYKTVKRALTSRHADAPPLLIVAISASLANTFASVLRVPCELVKQRLQAGIYPDVLTALAALSASGVRGFFVPGAIASQLARDIPFGVAMLVAYETFKSLLTRLTEEGKQPPPWAGALCGAAAGAIATLLTNPMDVMKTRMLVTMSAEASLGTTPLAIANSLLAAEGWPVFFRGVVPRLCHKIPASGMFWLLYEAFAALLGAEQQPGVARRAVEDKEE